MGPANLLTPHNAPTLLSPPIQRRDTTALASAFTIKMGKQLKEPL